MDYTPMSDQLETDLPVSSEEFQYIDDLPDRLVNAPPQMQLDEALPEANDAGTTSSEVFERFLQNQYGCVPFWLKGVGNHTVPPS